MKLDFNFNWGIRLVTLAVALLLEANVASAGIYYVVHKLVREDDGSTRWWSGAAYIVLPGESPTARELAYESAREAERDPTVVKAIVVKEGEDGPLPSQGPETQNDPRTTRQPSDDVASDQEATSPQKEDDAGGLEGLRSRLENTGRDIVETLRDVAESYEHDVESAVERVQRLADFLDKNVEQLNDQNFSDIEKLIGDYNRLSEKVTTGPLSESFVDLKPLKPFKPGEAPTPIEAREMVLDLQSRLDEASIQLETSGLEDAYERLQVEAQEIAEADALGEDVTASWKSLEARAAELADEEGRIQQLVHEHDQRVTSLDALRAEIEIETKLAETRERQRAAELADRNRRTAAPPRPAAPTDSIIGTWSDRGTSWSFNANGTFSGQARGTWKKTNGGIAIKYSGASKWINLMLQGDRLVDVDGYIGGLRLRKTN